MGGGGGIPLAYTPTWVIAAVCSVIVLISFTVERLIHSIGKYLKKKKKPKALFEALQTLKEELMLLGFISLLLGVFQNAISRICIRENLTHKFLPCNKKQGSTSEHFQISFRRSLLAKTSGESPCGKDKVPLLSVEALHDLHIFIFVLATVHVISTVLTIILGLTKIREWQRWENSILEGKYDPNKVLQKRELDVNGHAFVRGNFMCGKNSAILGWMSALIKQFHHSVTKSDYTTLRQGFVMTHCKDIPKFNFYKYMIRCLEDDFKQVVGIRWYLWIVVVIFLLLNVDGWHIYFWLSFFPLIVSDTQFGTVNFQTDQYKSNRMFWCDYQLLFLVGTKLEHVMVELARAAAKTHQKGEVNLVIELKNEHFWFHRPHIVLNLIHFILFQNAFEMAVFFWIWIMFGFNCCIMGQIYFIIPRLVIGIIVQLMCSYSTLPLYAIVTQMGSSFKAAIFSKTVNRGIAQWVQDAHKKKDLKGKKDSTIEVQSEIVDDKV